jgi:hypothetical protein
MLAKSLNLKGRFGSRELNRFTLPVTELRKIDHPWGRVLLLLAFYGPANGQGCASWMTARTQVDANAERRTAENDITALGYWMEHGASGVRPSPVSEERN